MQIRPEQAKDKANIGKILDHAFGSPVEAKLVAALRIAGDIEISLVAEAEGQLVGHILFSPMAAPCRALGLGPIGVLPEHQHKGIGSMLISEGVALAKATGWQGIFLLGDAAFYRRFGFSADTAKTFTSPYAGPHFQALELASGALIGKTGRVDYAPAFSQFE